jgi:hypothetical protein
MQRSRIGSERRPILAIGDWAFVRWGRLRGYSPPNSPLIEGPPRESRANGAFFTVAWTARHTARLVNPNNAP